MLALIDGDLLVYESAFAGQDRETGEIHSFDYVEAIILDKIRIIKQGSGADKVKLFLTGPNNFRFNIAKTKPYKGTRLEEKPFHYANVRAYIASLPNTVVTDGIEADDAMCIEQMRAYYADPYDVAAGKMKKNLGSTIICSRDKDLRMCPGWHYGWEHGNQPEFFPEYVDNLGYITLEIKGTPEKPRKDIKGTGLKFFYSQLITGDKTDNIPGLPKGGAVMAYSLLHDKQSEQEMYEAVAQAYQEKLGDDYQAYLLEQGQLLWMVRELDEEGKPVMWKLPYDYPPIPEQQ